MTTSTPRNTPGNSIELLRQLDWRYELLAVLLVLAEASLVYLVTGVMLAAARPGGEVFPAWVVAMLMLVAYLVPHLLDEWRVWSPTYEVIMAAAIAGSLLIAIKAGAFPDIAIWNPDWLRQTFQALALLPNDAVRPVWGIVLLAAYAWWRGRTRSEASVDSAYSLLRNGAFALAVILIVILMAVEDGAEVRERLSIATIAFFASALAAVGVARLRLEGFRTSSPLGPRWLATFVAPILAVVALAIIAAGILSRQFLDTVLWMLSPVFLVLHLVFQAFVLILAVIAIIVLTPIAWLIGDRELQPLPATPAASDLEQQPLERAADGALQLPDPLRYLVAALILFLIFSVLTKFVFRRRRQERPATEEERESVFDWDDLFGFLKTRPGAVRRRREVADSLAHLRGDPRWRHTLAIRETYLKLQDRGGQAGRPRRVAETADEYGPDLARRVATERETQAAVGDITEAYRAARYSGVPAEERDAADVDDAWRRIERG